MSRADGQGIMTILRDQRTTRGDFIFYADRLSTLIVEKALELIPHCPKQVQTPLKINFDGVTQTNDVCHSPPELDVADT
jgi:uridine kinase